jgi:plasmid maintenance system antidote protein VapI
MAKSRRLPPIHPGEILREDFMVPLGITRTSWPLISVSLLLVPRKSCTSVEALLPTRPCALDGI